MIRGGLMKKIVREIRILQNIKDRDRKVFCPYCGNRAVNIKGDHWSCSRCLKNGDLMELLRLAEEDYLYEHKNFKKLSSDTKGVGY